MPTLTNPPDLDEHSHLEDSQDWNEDVACWLAEQEHIVLSKAHWEVIYFFRNFYAKHHAIPATRLLVKAIAEQLGVEKGNSIYFPLVCHAKRVRLQDYQSQHVVCDSISCSPIQRM